MQIKASVLLLQKTAEKICSFTIQKFKPAAVTQRLMKVKLLSLK